MERLRVREREAGMFTSFPTTADAPNPNCVGTEPNPTVEWLNAVALTLPKGKFYALTGVIPVVDGTVVGACYVGQSYNGATPTGKWTITNVSE